MQSRKKVGVIGARGYAGLELISLLLGHPRVGEVVFSATEAFPLETYLPPSLHHGERTCSFKSVHKLLEDSDEIQSLDVVFFTTPHDVSAGLVPRFLDRCPLVIDLSGAFRLEGRGFYGLQPWGARSRDGNSSGISLVANPGCYPTAALMSLIPLLRRGYLDPDFLVLDGKSGTTGAGRSPQEGLLFSEVDGECRPYRVGSHQHWPEIQEHLFRFTERQCRTHFTTHLLSVKRGLLVSSYGHLTESSLREEDLLKAYAEDYRCYPLVEWGSTDSSPWLLSWNRVVGTPLTQIGIKVVGTQVYIFSLIDNLLKGAASQAIENWNFLMGWDPLCGIIQRVSGEREDRMGSGWSGQRSGVDASR